VPPIARPSTAAALDDAEERLAGRPVLLVPGHAAVEPTVGALGRAGGVVAVGVEGRALIEGERDVGAEAGLNLHRDLGREEQLAAVAGRAEAGALLGDLDLGAVVAFASTPLHLVRHAPVGERKDLETAGIGDQRPVPVHEPVQVPGGGDPLVPRRVEQVVGVAEDQLVAEPDDLVGVEPPHRPLGGQRDEGRRLDRAVRGRDDARAGCPVAGVDAEAEACVVVTHARSVWGSA
jgi:hypothetical protein